MQNVLHMQMVESASKGMILMYAKEALLKVLNKAEVSPGASRSLAQYADCVRSWLMHRGWHCTAISHPGVYTRLAQLCDRVCVACRPGRGCCWRWRGLMPGVHHGPHDLPCHRCSSYQRQISDHFTSHS